VTDTLRRAVCLLVAVCGATLASGVSAAERLVVGPAGVPLTLQQALDIARDGDVIDILPGEYRGQHVVLDQRRLLLRGVGTRPVFNAERNVAAPRAIWTVKGGEVVIENIEFRGARAQDAGGAGVRQEGGALLLRDCVFYDNEHGVLALNDDKATLTIENTQFGLAPQIVGGLPHLLNVGRIGKLSVTGSKFQQAFEGHMIRSRARESFIGYNFLHDGTSGGGSYEIDLPTGGVATVIGNVIAQSPLSQNRVMVAFGAESQAWEANALYLAHNTLINNRVSPAWFLRVWRDKLPAGTEVVAINNLLVGSGVFWLGASGQFQGNRPATLGMLMDSATYAFQLPPDSIWRGSGVDPRQVSGQNLSPKAEFNWPMGTKPLSSERSSWSPGAFQK